MARQAISVTLESDNLTWLKGRAGAAGESVSELLDQLVTAARQSGDHSHTRSVAGTIAIAGDDPLLEQADAAVQRLYDVSLRRPALVRERAPKYKTRRSPSAGRGRAR
jgi:hypothetical protein